MYDALLIHPTLAYHVENLSLIPNLRLENLWYNDRNDRGNKTILKPYKGVARCSSQ